jgi:hypothetical protein
MTLCTRSGNRPYLDYRTYACTANPQSVRTCSTCLRTAACNLLYVYSTALLRFTVLTLCKQVLPLLEQQERGEMLASDIGLSSLEVTLHT